MATNRESKGATYRSAIITIVVIHVIGSGLGSYYLSEDSNEPFRDYFAKVGINGFVFFHQLFVVGVFFYTLIACMYFFGFPFSEPLKTVSGIAAFSLAIAILLSANQQNSSGVIDRNMTLWYFLYVLLAERQSLIVFFGLATVILIGGIYYVIRSFLTVEYTGGSGIQLKLPGQTVYYLPIFPQVSWQNTQIYLEKGDKYEVDLYGYVSPGALDVPRLQEHTDNFINRQVKWKEQGRSKDDKEIELPIWPYGPPSGYPRSFYGPNKSAILREHKIWKENYYYEDNDCLTVKGQTHNKVFGIIQSDDEEPRKAIAQAGYDWREPDHKSQLIELSSISYPKQLEAQRSGNLWVVINDDDEARWDNAGLFFLKLTIKSRLLSKQ